MARSSLWKLLGVALAGSFALAAPVSAAEREIPPLYRWIDAEGVVRYTPDKGRIPLRRRGSAEVVARDMPTLAPDSYRHETDPGPEWTSPIGQTVFPSDAPAESAVAPSAAGTAGVPSPEPPRETTGTPAAPGDLDAQIAALEAEIDRDEEVLKAMISRDATDGVPTLVSDPGLREIARRIPALQSRLEALREERERQLGP